MHSTSDGEIGTSECYIAGVGRLINNCWCSLEARRGCRNLKSVIAAFKKGCGLQWTPPCDYDEQILLGGTNSLGAIHL